MQDLRCGRARPARTPIVSAVANLSLALDRGHGHLLHSRQPDPARAAGHDRICRPVFPAPATDPDQPALGTDSRSPDALFDGARQTGHAVQPGDAGQTEFVRAPGPAAFFEVMRSACSAHVHAGRRHPRRGRTSGGGDRLRLLRRFGGAPTIGRTLTVGACGSIVGVAGFFGADGPPLHVAIRSGSADDPRERLGADRRSTWWLSIIAPEAGIHRPGDGRAARVQPQIRERRCRRTIGRRIC